MSTLVRKTCYIGPEMSIEQFIPEHFFIYMVKGTLNGYVGNKEYSLVAHESYLVRKNQLGRYNKPAQGEEPEKVILVFDEPFLKKFQERHEVTVEKRMTSEAAVWLRADERIPEFIHSLQPYYTGSGKIDSSFSEVKREELLLLLLQTQPELAGILFDFGVPEKINLEEFMNRHYTFNISLQQFAFLTGRSLSAFKRDFKAIFHNTPNRWLVQRRLQEAYLLIHKLRKKPAEIYIDLGFEDLSHFSFAFKKQFGLTPTELAALKKL
ncbi:helix-turn-helix domain-containing protein [Dinghuibacter silviterrae]|uniref:AraC-like DNA-binding protein n=1 Tax=Dinghuibacter silviterrae TaxID=1539049 RepID=A0A4V3GLZ6_9BACT|nr:AraC family transcriptional regulator [Dinghuibacter silviterrae]TDX01443.1 AraC-like DNA-binding protein [Dinghuibacter silviterrae]